MNKIALLGLFILLIGLGCISLHIDYNQKFYRDGSSDLLLKIQFPKNNYYTEDISCSDLKLNTGFNCTQENGFYLISGIEHFSSPEDSGYYSFETKEDLFTREYTIKIYSYPHLGGEDSKYYEEFKFKKLSATEYGLYKDMDIVLNYTVNVPGYIEYTNGNKLSANSVNWDLIEYLYNSGDQPLEVRSKEYKWINIGALLVIVTFGVIIFRFIRPTD